MIDPSKASWFSCPEPPQPSGSKKVRAHWTSPTCCPKYNHKEITKKHGCRVFSPGVNEVFLINTGGNKITHNKERSRVGGIVALLMPMECPVGGWGM